MQEEKSLNNKLLKQNSELSQKLKEQTDFHNKDIEILKKQLEDLKHKQAEAELLKID